MTRLIDADAFKKENERLLHCDFPYLSETTLEELIDEAPTIDAVPLDGSFLKMSRGDYLIYKRHWLYEHFDMEMDIQRSAMKSMGYEPALKDAEPVRHGKWMKCDEDKWEHIYALRCSECHGGYHLSHETTTAWNYCPNCGADMRGTEDGDK